MTSAEIATANRLPRVAMVAIDGFGPEGPCPSLLINPDLKDRVLPESASCHRPIASEAGWSAADRELISRLQAPAGRRAGHPPPCENCLRFLNEIAFGVGRVYTRDLFCRIGRFLFGNRPSHVTSGSRSLRSAAGVAGLVQSRKDQNQQGNTRLIIGITLRSSAGTTLSVKLFGLIFMFHAALTRTVRHVRRELHLWQR